MPHTKAITHHVTLPHARSRSRLLRGGAEFVLLALLLGLIGVALLQPVTGERYAIDLTVKEPDTRLELAGFYLPEANDEFSYRWSSPYGFIQLPNAANLASGYLAELRMRVPAPDPSRHVTLLVNEQPLVELTPAPEFRVYRVAVGAPPGDGLRLGISAPPMQLAGDVRPLGVVVTRAALRPLVAGRVPLAALTVIGLAIVWALARWRHATMAQAAVICGVLAAAIAGVSFVARPTPLPLPLLAGTGLVAAALAIQLAHGVIARAGLALLATLVAFSSAVWSSWLADDAFISFRYAQNFVQGNGLVYNVGERVEGYTNFLWTVLAALVIRLGGDVVFWAYLAGVLIGLALLLATFALARDLFGEMWAVLAAMYVATSQGVLIYTARGAGMETGLFALLLVAGSWCYLRALGYAGMPGSSPIWLRAAGVLLALATLTRPEGALVFGLTLAHAVLLVLTTSRRTPALGARLVSLVPLLISYVMLVMPFFLWRLVYYGDLLPNTFYVKTGGGMRAALRGLAYTAGFVAALGGPLLALALVPMLSAVRDVPRGRTVVVQFARSWPGYLLGICAVYTLYIVSVGGDHFPGTRFFVPIVPWLGILVAAGMRQCALWASKTRLRAFVPALLGALMAWYGAYALLYAPEQNVILRGSDESLRIWRELGWWMADHAAPGETIAAMSAGAIAYYSERTTIDMLGLTDRHIARVASADFGSGPAGHERRDPAYVLDVRQPTYIPQMWQDYFGDQQVLEQNYSLIQATTRTGRTIALWKRTP